MEVPKSKPKLLIEIDDGNILRFREKEWPAGHAPTDYGRWFRATKPYFVDWKEGLPRRM